MPFAQGLDELKQRIHEEKHQMKEEKKSLKDKLRYISLRSASLPCLSIFFALSTCPLITCSHSTCLLSLPTLSLPALSLHRELQEQLIQGGSQANDIQQKAHAERAAAAGRLEDERRYAHTYTYTCPHLQLYQHIHSDLHLILHATC
jgi:hypothetical protein